MAVPTVVEPEKFPWDALPGPAISQNARLFSIAHIFAHSEQLVISLPVLRHRKVVGIVARQDVIRAVLKMKAKISQPREATLYLSGLEKERHEIAKLR